MDSYTLIVLGFALLPFVLQRVTGKFITFAMLSLIPICLHGLYFFGPRILILLFITYIVSTIAELVSLKTPFKCFGVSYRYNLKSSFFSSRINLLGVYPLEVSLAWVLFKYLSFTMAVLISTAFALPFVVKIFFTPLILVSIDFIIDPLAVNVFKLWHWHKGSWYFGIPLRNFLGWYAVGLIASFLFCFVDTGKPATFHVLYFLPVVLYTLILRNIFPLTKLNKPLALFGSVPAITWTILGGISLIILSQR